MPVSVPLWQQWRSWYQLLLCQHLHLSDHSAMNSTAPVRCHASSTNATPITGTWNPATIGTTTAGTTTYTFTPDAGPVCCCGNNGDRGNKLLIMCQHLRRSDRCARTVPRPTLPLSSTNATAITGTWNPATINTATVGTTTYTFTPDAGQCATNATMDIVVTNSVVPIPLRRSDRCARMQRLL